MARIGTALVLVLSALAARPALAEDAGRAAPWARLAPLSSDERSLLERTDRVTRPLRFRRGADGEYLGGLSYQVVRARPADILAALAKPEHLRQMLPATERARLVSSTGRSAKVELVQGKGPFLARYTVHLEQAETGDSIRFWLDKRRPRDIRDLWGYFRVTPFGHGSTLVTVAAVVDLGPGFARTFFSDKVERVILRTPTRIKAFVEPRAVALLER